MPWFHIIHVWKPIVVMLDTRIVSCRCGKMKVQKRYSIHGDARWIDLKGGPSGQD